MTSRALLTALGLAAAASLAGADELLLNDSVIGGGRVVSAQFSVYQPFTVPDPGWHITSIGLDGFLTQDLAGLGMLGTLLPDLDGFPDGAHPIAEATYFLDYAIFPSEFQWVDQPFSVSLEPGRYWMRWSNNGEIAYVATVRNAANGEDSFSIRWPEGVIFDSGPTALRINGNLSGGSCIADWNADTFVNTNDFVDYLNDYVAASNGDPTTYGDPDLAAPFGSVNTADFLAYLNEYVAGC